MSAFRAAGTLRAGLLALALGAGCQTPPPRPPALPPTGAPPPSPPPLAAPPPAPVPVLAPARLMGCVEVQPKDAGQAPEPLPHVFVYIKEGLEGRKYSVPSEPVVLDQVNFQFVPHVFGIRAGQTLKITSQDYTQHNVFCQPFQNPAFNESMFGGECVEKKFVVPEAMILLQCNIHHIMKAYAGVLDHPFFAVTGVDGTYEIRGIPPGHYKLLAWQESMGNQAVELKLKEGEESTVRFTYK